MSLHKTKTDLRLEAIETHLRQASRWQFHLANKQGYGHESWRKLMARVSEGMEAVYG